jgi:carotenoid cleavage dioxygenase
LETGERQTHFLGNNVAGGEPIFVPASANSDEQDGYVFCLVHERETRTSKLAIIRADDFESKPVAEILIPQRVPYGAHGSWIPRN